MDESKQDNYLSFNNPVKLEVIRGGKVVATALFHNDVTDVGKTHILDSTFANATQITNWYIGLIDATGFTAVDATDTMVAHAGWTETHTLYDEATRVEWAPTTVAASTNNTTSRDFTINGAVSVRGIFVTSDATKGGAVGTLWATALFSSAFAFIAADVLRLTYTVTVT